MAAILTTALRRTREAGRRLVDLLGPTGDAARQSLAALLLNSVTSLVAVPVWLRVYAGPGASEIDYLPLVASLVAVVLLAKALAPGITASLDAIGAPEAATGVFIAALVLLIVTGAPTARFAGTSPARLASTVAS